jgi:hypothetical protein
VFAIQVGLIMVGPCGGWMRLPPVFDAWRVVPRGRSFLQIAGRAINIAITAAFTWSAMRRSESTYPRWRRRPTCP